jgi:hypothetical protein
MGKKNRSNGFFKKQERKVPLADMPPPPPPVEEEVSCNDA